MSGARFPVVLEQRVSPVSLDVTKRELFYVIQQGPKGEPGANGTGAAFEFPQPTPLSEWIINHNLGFTPALITVVDLAGYAVDCGVQHVSANQTRLIFNPPMAGKARLL
jgi:hypothetical protein